MLRVRIGARESRAAAIPGVRSISFTAGELGPAIRNTVSTVPPRSAWTASIPVSGEQTRRRLGDAVGGEQRERDAPGCRCPSGPMASRRPRSSRRSVGPGAVREKTHSGSKYRLASDTSDSVFACAVPVPPWTKARSTPLARVLEQPDVLDGARGLTDLERDALARQPLAVLLGVSIVGAVGAAGGDHHSASAAPASPTGTRR